MANRDPIRVIAGFSLTNRWLLYASLMLTPAQALSGVGSHAPTNIGFLAYNYYPQYLWCTAAKSNQIHALALLPTYLDLIYAVTYLGGIPAGNVPMGILLGLGTAGLLLMNTITAWIALKTNLPREMEYTNSSSSDGGRSRRGGGGS